MNSANDISVPAVLHRCPGCFSLPSADPQAIAVETLLRISGAHFIRKDAPIADLSLHIPAPSQPRQDTPKRKQKHNAVTYTRYDGLSNCMKTLSSSVNPDIVHNDLKPVVACIEALTARCLFPAFTFLVHYDPSLFQYAVRRSVVPKVGTLWESMRGTYRLNVLRANMYCYTGTPVFALPKDSISMTVAIKVREVLEDVEKALKSIELLHVSHARADETFLLGTARPCTADAFAYAAVSSFLHADFSGSHGSVQLTKFQKKMREECPLLLKYAEKLRVMFYEEYSGSYFLKPTLEGTSEFTKNNVEDMYRRGRFATLVLTGMFAALYFLVVNADTIIELGDIVAEEIEQGEQEAMETAAVAAA